MQQFQENILLVLQHLLLPVTQETLFIMQTQVKQDMLVGFILSDNAWRRFGAISFDSDTLDVVFDSVGIGTTNSGDGLLRVGAGTSLFAVDNDGVGIGTTANGFKLRVVGDSIFSGTVTAEQFLEMVLTSLTLIMILDGVLSTGLYPNNLLNVGIGTEVPLSDVNLTVGYVGSSGTSMHVY